MVKVIFVVGLFKGNLQLNILRHAVAGTDPKSLRKRDKGLETTLKFM